MSVVFEVAKQGYGWQGQYWYYLGAGQDCYIGVATEMTGFVFTPSRNLRRVTIKFNVDTANANVRYSITKPTVSGSSAPGTDIVLAVGENSITVDGDFRAGETYTLWVWGTGGAWHSLVRYTPTGTGEESGTVRIRVGGEWGLYEPYIRAGGSWVRCEPYVYYDGAWRKTE